jgi:hypothetical protein
MAPAWRLSLTALETRLSSTCLRRWRSAWTVGEGSSGGWGLDGDLALGGQRADRVDGVLDDLEHLHRLR